MDEQTRQIDTSPVPPADDRRRPLWIAGGCAMVIVQLGVALSMVFSPRNIPRQAAGLTLAGFALLLILPLLRRGRLSRRGWLWAIAVAVLLRCMMFYTPPTLSSDVSRYLWDGAVTAAGVTPYRYPPDTARSDVAPPALRPLARQGRPVLDDINHPHLATVYPPVAQGLFALPAMIRPFDIQLWRATLLLVELPVAMGAWLVLRRSRARPEWLLAYLWNPLLVVETYSAGHMDLTMAPLLLLAALALSAGAAAVGALALAVATGLKLWPAALLPMLLVRLQRRPATAAGAMILFIGAVAVMALPVVASIAPSDSGFVAYGRDWTANGGIFPLLFQAAVRLDQRLPLGIDPRLTARGMVVALVLASAVMMAPRRAVSSSNAAGRLCVVGMALLLLSPTVYPWYFVPLIPLSAAARRPVLLYWTAALPLLYLTGTDDAHVWALAAVHVPTWGLLLWQAAEILGQPAPETTRA